MLERGASGFTGWTEGLRRTQDAAALKRMYKAKRPDDVATLQVELAVEGALEVDEVGGLDDDEEGEGDAGGVEQEEDGDESEEEEEGLAMHAAIGGGTRPSKRAVRARNRVEPLVQSDLVLWSSATARIGSTRRELPAVSVPDGARLRARLRA